jgi:FkbM family methyltransferase
VTLSRQLVRVARQVVGSTGYDLVPRASGALQRLAEAGIAPTTVIDVGAALGDWSRHCARSFPQARFVLVEPLQEFAAAVQQTAGALGGLAVQAAAGAEHGERTINVHTDLVGSSLLREREGAAVDGTPRPINVTTIDDLVAAHELRAPFVIKLDVQGAELDALAGAQFALKSADAVVVEVSFFSFFVDGSPFDEVIARMRSADFVVFDIENLARRPLDGALAQADITFVRDDGPARAQHVYASPAQRAAQNHEFARTIRRRIERVGGS